MHLFISHKNTERDAALTRELVSFLEERGVFCWVDFNDLRLGDWREQIERARRTASAYIFVVSEDLLLGAEECTKELRNILEGGGKDRLIPFFADDYYFTHPEISDKYNYELGPIAAKQGVKLSSLGKTEAFERIYLYLPPELKENKESLSGFEFSADMSALVSYTGNAESVTVMGVRAIGDRAFLGCETLQKIKVCDGVQSIGKHAFRDCPQLVFAEGGGGLTECSATVIEKNSSAVRLTDGVYCFLTAAIGCEGEPTELKIPEGVRVIASGAFRDCFSLQRVTLPESVVSIGASAFDGCINLSEINLSEKVCIGKSAFADTLIKY